ncbi:MAG: hypothetical protein SVG88_08680 [Halobacteriales archaeon]|nr:hypothetical protein [Halobacteriales archaeon]
MSFAVGFLVGSLLLLVGVLYFTRIRGSAVPQAKAVQPEESSGGASTPMDNGDSGPDFTPERETCELCNEQRVCREVSGMTVCSSCETELL